MRQAIRGALWAVMVVGIVMASPISVRAADSTEANTRTARFDFSLRGFRAGILTFSGEVQAGRYHVTGELHSSGIVRLVRNVSYRAESHGIFASGRFTPALYIETSDTGKRQSQATMAYRDGVPQLKSYVPARAPRPGDVDPVTQGGTLDPLTALYAVLRDVPRDQVCRFDRFMFDGRRRSSLRLYPPTQPKGIAAPTKGTNGADKIICTGEYRRLQGFSDKEMAQKQSFVFQLTYAPIGSGQMQVVEVLLDSLYGPAALTRR